MRTIVVGGGVVILAIAALMFNMGNGLGIAPGDNINDGEGVPSAEQPVEVTVRDSEYVMAGQPRTLSEVLTAINELAEGEQKKTVRLVVEGDATAEPRTALESALKSQGVAYTVDSSGSLAREPLKITVRGSEYFIDGESKSLDEVLAAAEKTPADMTTRVQVLLDGTAERGKEAELMDALKAKQISYAEQELPFE
jgi:biopolymer transport protein ExbD